MSSLNVLTPLFIPSPASGVWEVFGFPLRAYALCIIAGIIVGMIIAGRRWRARGGSQDTLELVIAVSIPCGIVGARLYHVITDYQLYFGPGRDPLDALKIWNGGLGIWGAVAAGVAGAYLVARRKQVRFPALLDAVAPGLVVAQAIGRLGNWFNQELFGRPTTLPWGLEIDERYRPNGYEAVRHLPPHLPVRAGLEPRGRRGAGLGRPQVEARARQGVRALRGALHRRPVLDRGAADRQRERDRRIPAEQLHVADRVRGGAGLAHLVGQEPAGSGDRGRGTRTDRLPVPDAAGDTSPAESEQRR